MAAPIPWRRYQESTELPRLAPGPGGVGTKRRASRHDPRSHGTGTISTNNAIRANFFARAIWGALPPRRDDGQSAPDDPGAVSAPALSFEAGICVGNSLPA